MGRMGFTLSWYGYWPDESVTGIVDGECQLDVSDDVCQCVEHARKDQIGFSALVPFVDIDTGSNLGVAAHPLIFPRLSDFQLGENSFGCRQLVESAGQRNEIVEDVRFTLRNLRSDICD
jgi:hypothetical protein